MSDSSINQQQSGYEFPWSEFLDEQLAKIASLRRNWDRMDAEIPHCDAIKDARSFLGKLAPMGLNIPKPGVSPTASGGLQFDWQLSSKAFEIEFETNGSISYVYEDEEKLISHEESLHPGEHTGCLLTYLQKMYS